MIGQIEDKRWGHGPVRPASKAESTRLGDGPPPDLAAAGDSRVSRIECPACGYEPTDQVNGPKRRCPKCFSGTWTTVVRARELRAPDHRWFYEPSVGRPSLRCVLPGRC